MIGSPYKEKIENLLRKGLMEIKKNNFIKPSREIYDFADRYFDEASILFMEQSMFYSQGICLLEEFLEENENISNKEKEGIKVYLNQAIQEFTAQNEQWKSMIELHRWYKR